MEIDRLFTSLFLELFNNEQFLFQEHLSGGEFVFTLFEFELVLLRLLVKGLNFFLQMFIGFFFLFKWWFKFLNNESKLLKLNKIRIDLSLNLHFFSFIAYLLVIKRNQAFDNKH